MGKQKSSLTSAKRGGKPALVTMKKRKPNQSKRGVGKKVPSKSKSNSKNANPKTKPKQKPVSKVNQPSTSTRSSPRFKQDANTVERTLRGRVVKYAHTPSPPPPLTEHRPSRTSARARKVPASTSASASASAANLTPEITPTTATVATPAATATTTAAASIAAPAAAANGAASASVGPPKRARTSSETSSITESVDDPAPQLLAAFPAPAPAQVPLHGLRRFVGFNRPVPTAASAANAPAPHSEASTLSVDAPRRDAHSVVATPQEMRTVMRWLELATTRGEVRITPPHGWSAPSFILRPCTSLNTLEDEQVIPVQQDNASSNSSSDKGDQVNALSDARFRVALAIATASAAEGPDGGPEADAAAAVAGFDAFYGTGAGMGDGAGAYAGVDAGAGADTVGSADGARTGFGADASSNSMVEDARFQIAVALARSCAEDGISVGAAAEAAAEVARFDAAVGNGDGVGADASSADAGAVTEEEVLDGSGLIREDGMDVEEHALDGVEAAPMALPWPAAAYAAASASATTTATNASPAATTASRACVFGSGYQQSAPFTSTSTTGAAATAQQRLSDDSPIPAACYRRAWGFTPASIDEEEILDSGDANDIAFN